MIEATVRRAEVELPVAGVTLPGDLVIPSAARGVVVFAHGSGSSRNSSRNRLVAERLAQSRIGTLLFDLLTPEEDARDEVEERWDIPLLARRLTGVIDWLGTDEQARELPLGLFGASTGAAAALEAAASRPDHVAAVVSRGGRPDLAADDALAAVRAPTLLIVGGNDEEVLELNREAAARLTARVELVVIAGATHLFPEPGALGSVARLATSWFEEQFPTPSGARPPTRRF